MGPPIRPINIQHVRAQTAIISLRPVFNGPTRIFNPISLPKGAQPSTEAVSQLDLAVLPSVDTAGPVNPIGNLIWKPEAAPPPRPTEAPQRTSTGPIRVTSTIQMAKIVKQAMPTYPPLARSARISGVVHLVGVIAKDGTIRNLQLLSGHPLLTRAALEAVSQWVYKPTLLNGEPVEVICPIDVNFTLSQ